MHTLNIQQCRKIADAALKINTNLLISLSCKLDITNRLCFVLMWSLINECIIPSCSRFCDGCESYSTKERSGGNGQSYKSVWDTEETLAYWGLLSNFVN